MNTHSKRGIGAKGTTLMGGAMFALMGGITPSTASAQTQATESLEIVVTARFREERAQDVGESIAVIDAQTIQDAGLTDFTSLAVRVPGLNFSGGGPNRNSPRIRGISSAVGLQDAVSAQPLISQTINEVSINAPGFNQLDVQLYDIGRVEVLKGPQGTRFGEGAAGGALRYFLPDPDLSSFGVTIESTARVTEDGGSGLDGWVAVNAPLMHDKLAVRGMIYGRSDDGFIDNTVTREEDANGFDIGGGRLSVLFEPTDRLSINLFAVGENADTNADYFVTTGGGLEAEDLKVAQPGPDGRSEEYRLYGANVSYDFGPMKLQSITGRFERDTERLAYDATFSFLLNVFSGLPGDVVLDQTTTTESTSQELRLISEFEGPLNFVLGAFYRELDFNNVQARTTPAITSTSFDGSSVYVITDELLAQKQQSFYVDGSFKLTPRITLLAGARYFDEEIEGSTLDGFNAPLPAFGILTPPERRGDDVEISALLPRASVEYRPIESLLLYASYAEGARNGGINSPTSAGFFPDPEAAIRFEEDRVVSYEIGLKSEWERLVFNAAVYQNYFDDMQIFFRDPILGSALTRNGPDAEITGVEVEAIFTATDWLDVFARATTVDGEFVTFSDTDAADGLAPGADPNDIAPGDRLSFTPELTFNVGAQARAPLGGGALVARIDYSQIDDFIDDAETQTELEGYERLDLRLGYERDRWSVTAFVNNATNDIPILSTSLLEGTAVGTPRVIGLTLRAQY